jgi:uncharacterized protein YbaP (TraB family)
MAFRVSLLALSLAAVTPLAFAQTQAAPTAPAKEAIRAEAEEIKPLPPGAVIAETVVVTGVQPGPGMWKVKKGENTLWILGTISPLPKDIVWESREVEAVIAQSQAVLASPSVTLKTDRGFFGNLMLVPSLLKARKNPDGKELNEVLPADIYARWEVLKAKYIGSNNSVEEWRPIFAAQELYNKGVEKSDLSFENRVWPVVTKAAEKNKIPVLPSKVEVVLEEPKKAIKEFSAGELNDTECFSKTMQLLETDIRNMVMRGNAWAIGEVAILKSLPFTNNTQACINAFLNTGMVQKRGLGDLGERQAAKWMATAETALNTHRSSLAVLPMSELIKDNGYLSRLKAKGYTIEEPPPTRMQYSEPIGK